MPEGPRLGTHTDLPTRVLIVTFAFPPALGSGIHRVLGWARYLPRFGFEPVILTAREPYAPAWDPGITQRIPEGLMVVRTPWIYPGGWVKTVRSAIVGGGQSTASAVSPLVPIDSTSRISGVRDWVHRHLLVPDAAIGWFPHAIAAARRAVRDQGCRAIISTSPYPTSHLVAMAASRREGEPWVADFRDLWSQSVLRVHRGAIRSRIEKLVDKGVVRRADYVTTASEGIAVALRTFAGPTGAKIRVVRNGYDPDLTAGLTRTRPERFTIVHTGRFYGRDRSPEPLLRAVGGLTARGALDPSRMEIRLVGAGSDGWLPGAHGSLGAVVRPKPQLPHREAIQEQLNASVLLLISGPDAHRIGAIPAKLYEYLAVRRPILALCPPDSEPAEIVERANAGVVVPPDDENAIAHAVLELYRRFVVAGDLAWEGRPDVVEEFARPRSTAQLAEVLRSALEPDGPAGQRHR